MTHPFNDSDFDEYDRLCHEAILNHRPDLEPYASMSIGQIDGLMRATDKLLNLRRYLMLENFLRDKMTANELLVHKMAKEVSRWALRRFGKEYPAMTEEGVLGHAAAVFAKTLIRSVSVGPDGSKRRL
jgi:hypothetical protein